MKIGSSRRLLTEMALLGLCAVMAMGQETTIRPTQPEMESFLAMPKAEFDAKLSGWTMCSINHVDSDKLKTEWATSRPVEKIHLFQCGGSAATQQWTAKDFAKYADVYSYLAFLYGTSDKPSDGELLWGGLDNPFINHVRKMRQLVGTTPIVAQLLGNVGIGKSERSSCLEEVQWEFVALAGCGYRGVIWPVPYKDVAWGDDLRQIEERTRRYGRFLAQAYPVDWAKAAKDQAISASARDNYLFVFLLNPAYMNLDADGTTVVAPLEKPLCEGSVTLALPDGLKVRRGQTLLGGKAPRLALQDGKTIVPFGFRTGGEIMVFTLSGKAEPAATTQPTTKPPVTQPAVTEIKQ